MKFYYVLSTTFTGLALMPLVYAGSWDISQETSVNDSLSLSQSNTSNKSTQGIHQININSGTVNTATQRMNMNGHNVNLSQNNGTTNSRQFINEISSSKIQQARQSLSSYRHINMAQHNGSNNVQAINSIVSSGSGALQAGNLQQNISNGNTISFSQTGGSNNIQAINIVQAGSTTGANISQNANGNSVSYSQSGGQNNLQTINATILSNGNAGSQTVTQSATFTSIGAADPHIPDPVTGNIRAINYIKIQP